MRSEGTVINKLASGGGGGGSSAAPTYPVSTPSKAENGSVSISSKNAAKGTTVTITVKPNSGYTLETMKRLVEQSGLIFVEALDADTHGSVTETSERIYVIAREHGKNPA